MENLIDDMIQELDLKGIRVARSEIKKFIIEIKKQLKYQVNFYDMTSKKLVGMYIKKLGGSRR